MTDRIIKEISGNSVVFHKSERVNSDYWGTKRAQFEDITTPMYLLCGSLSFHHVRGSFDAFRLSSGAEKWMYVHDSDNYAPMANTIHISRYLLCRQTDSSVQIYRAKLPWAEPIVFRSGKFAYTIIYEFTEGKNRFTGQARR